MSDGGSRPVWRHCQHCPKKRAFKTADEFRTHLRERHCTKEGGSFVCRYGDHDVCSSLPLEGVSDEDYEAHVSKHHLLREWPDAVAEARWTVHRSAQNLPAVLNDPRRSRREADFFTRTWGDHFTEAPPAGGDGAASRITRRLFEPYLAHCARPLCLPAVFLGPELRLEEPAVFAQAYPVERLTHYLDVVEVHLARQVSLRSGAFFQALQLLATLHQAQPTIQRLLASGDFARALDFIEASREILALELAGVQSLRHLDAQLAELERHIERSMAADLSRGLSRELNRPPDDLAPLGHQEEDCLASLVAGMLRLGVRSSFASLLRDEACTALRAALKTCQAEAQSRGEPWTALLERALTAAERVLRRAHALAGLQRRALELAALGETPLVQGQGEEAEAALRGALATLGELAQERCARLVPADAHRSPLHTGAFPGLCQRADQCSEQWARLCQHRSQALVLALRTQADRFVSCFHEEHKAKLGLLLDGEVWTRVEVPAELQRMVDEFAAPSDHGSVTGKASAAASAPQLLLASEGYSLAGSSLLLVRMVLEYCGCVRQLPGVGLSLAAKLQELLRLFNSRTSQLVLGAGALHRLGLKTITAGMLALAARCLQLLLALLPRVKAHFEQHLAATRRDTARHFDVIAKEYADHVAEIFAKLASIVSNVLDGQLAEWEVKAPVPSPAFRGVVRHLSKFHAAVSELLSPADVATLLQSVHTAFRAHLGRHLARLQISRDGGPQHGYATQWPHSLPCDACKPSTS
ncbi:hypothetical protein HPB48_005669 [Haemaphysalis longicornis]|uniref:Vacuolar protein sorting-associated protein 54 C-terminal domain-containing protein n=1 Tax=Haemaphysalis longicornis TaxID=44386 RepID=A0A9J6GM38_HAELO|nr:hypothetical protein HPB48_005669 [Haemaphysalis longicornis]